MYTLIYKRRRRWRETESRSRACASTKLLVPGLPTPLPLFHPAASHPAPSNPLRCTIAVGLFYRYYWPLLLCHRPLLPPSLQLPTFPFSLCPWPHPPLYHCSSLFHHYHRPLYYVIGLFHHYHRPLYYVIGLFTMS